MCMPNLQRCFFARPALGRAFALSQPAIPDLTRSRDSVQVRARTLNARCLRVGCVAFLLVRGVFLFQGVFSVLHSSCTPASVGLWRETRSVVCARPTTRPRSFVALRAGWVSAAVLPLDRCSSFFGLSVRLG